ILFSNIRTVNAGCGAAVAQTLCTDDEDDIYNNPVFNLNICVNEPVDIGTYSCCGTVTYTANFVNGCTTTFPFVTTASTFPDFTCAFSTPGSYQIVATFTSCGIVSPCYLCENHTATFNIYVYDNSMIHVSVAPTPVCESQPVTITSSLPFPTSVTNFA